MWIDSRLTRSMAAAALPALLVVAAACSDDTVRHRSGTGELSADEMADVALESDRITEQALSAEIAGLETLSASTTSEGTVTRDVTFSRSRPCPGGGTVEVEGEIHAILERETRTLEVEASGSRTRTDCVFAGNAHTVTVNATSRWEVSRRLVEREPDGPQTSRFSGSWLAERDDGEERACEFDVTVVRDPERHTRTLDGVICGTTIHRTVTWSGSE